MLYGTRTNSHIGNAFFDAKYGQAFCSFPIVVSQENGASSPKEFNTADSLAKISSAKFSIAIDLEYSHAHEIELEDALET